MEGIKKEEDKESTEEDKKIKRKKKQEVMKTGTSIKEEEEISESMKVRERFTYLPGHTEESEMGVKMAPVLGSGASSPCTGSSASPTGTSSSSRAASRTRTPFEGGRRINFKSPLIKCICTANDTLCADSSSCRGTAASFKEDDRRSQAKVLCNQWERATTNLHRNIAENQKPAKLN